MSRLGPGLALAGFLLAAGPIAATGPARAADGHGDAHAAPAADAHGGGGHGGGGHGDGGGHGAPAKPIEPLPVAPRGVPVEMVRTLQLLQDRIARGSTQAHLAQRQLLGHIEQRLAALEPETWAVPGNVRAAVTFALSGGGPGLLRRMLETAKLPEGDSPLVLGALAYLEGREREARTLLGRFDARLQPPGLAGQLALTQAAVTVREAPRKAIELLDLARLLAPGTLVEEGALRREIFIHAQGGDATRFETLSIQYLRRFRRSVYAGNFRQRFATALTRLDFDSDRARITRLERMLDEIEPGERRDLYLLVARAGLEQGRRETAIFAAERALSLAGPDSEPAARARLYRAAALIVVDGRYEEGLESLRGVDRAGLDPSDRALLDAALSTAGQIRGGAPPAPPVADAAAPAGRRQIPEAASIARAREALAQVDRMIDRTDP
ncbi:chemotaxis protein [Methylobacterium platani]|uniref:Chemotaxis protein MotC n=2 Tax=Methylobacterium platani TaxID=427683 RepID=A0A179SHV5_9HYPH|nr:chemotaxis protein [Methylobacterium platani]KMO13242.1 chemotaxis protein MotC [Methylobacterium platani JCM 14648]OAS27426.1 chemotaxis protein MotC [Methylobacterium platani]